MDSKAHLGIRDEVMLVSITQESEFGPQHGYALQQTAIIFFLGICMKPGFNGGVEMHQKCTFIRSGYAQS